MPKRENPQEKSSECSRKQPSPSPIPEPVVTTPLDDPAGLSTREEFNAAYDRAFGLVGAGADSRWISAQQSVDPAVYEKVLQALKCTCSKLRVGQSCRWRS